ncbi:MAG: FliH/SctL family protein [Syntrophomonadaceae bacterium]|nr:FliH/SctL family protein [Syntrophomonadaceae bacterium]
MSNIIKRSELLISQPKIIDLSTMYELERIKRESLASLENIVVEDIEEEIAEDKIEKERQELERLKLEGEKILNETELMVMELLQKVRDEAKTIIANAHEEAEVLREKMFEEATQIREKSQNEGYENGLKTAQQEIEADRLLAIQQNQELLEEARQTKLNMMKASESDMVRLAMAVAKRVIGSELATNPNVIINMLREALGFLDQPGNVTVYVNPQDVERIFKVMETETFTDIGSNDMQLNIYADGRIAAGGCMLESDAGSVDARVETRISNVEKAVQEVTADE